MTREKEYSLLLTDLNMPETNGFELLELLRASNVGNSRNIPVVVTTASGSCSKEELIGRGFAECLFKPFSISELIEVSDKCAIKGKSDEKPDFTSLLSYGNESVVLDKLITEARKKYAAAITDDARVSALKLIQELEQKKIVLNITAKYNSREQGELKPAGIPSVKGFDSKDIGKLTSPFVTEEDVKVNNDYATSLGAIATVMGSISQMTNEGASAWLTWSANLMTAIGTAIPAIEALIAAKKAESIGNAVASATQTPVVGWLLAGAAVASVIAAFATMPQFANGGVVDGNSFFGDKVLARVNSGEMILNKSQQSNLFNLLDGGSSVKGGTMSGEVEFKISDKALVGVLKQHNNRTNRLR